MRLIDADALTFRDVKVTTGEIDVFGFDGYYIEERKGILQEDIWEAPTIDAVPKWIPCEERLPEDGECVLAWAGGSVDVVRFEMGISQETREKMKKGEIPDPIEYVWCLADGYTPQKRSDSYCRSDEDWNNQKPYCWVHAPMEYFGQDVTAWMPLPEPYGGERKDDE